MLDRAQPAGDDPAPSIPRHIAIIMDGNGRWAAARGLSRREGHRHGVESVRRTVHAAIEFGIPHLTLFSFSSENWRRPKSEIADLMSLMKRFVRRDLADLHKHGVRIRVIGERESLETGTRRLIEEAESLTRENSVLNLTVAFNYGARDEIVRAARRLAEAVESGDVAASDIDEGSFASCFDTAGLPDPDLLIRTSGEMRLSNFLLWQLAYAELHFTDVYWPDFTAETLSDAISDFAARERRFGGLTARSTA